MKDGHLTSSQPTHHPTICNYIYFSVNTSAFWPMTVILQHDMGPKTALQRMFGGDYLGCLLPYIFPYFLELTVIITLGVNVLLT